MARSLGLSRGAWCGVALLLASACGDDGLAPTSDGSDGSTTDDATDSSSSADETASGSGSSASASATEGATMTTTVADSGSSGGPPPLEVEVQVYTYPNQPMVADLAFTAPDLEVTIEHASDPGIRSGTIAGTPGHTWIRVRGLTPDTEHVLGWTVQAPDGGSDAGEVMVATEAALPGFVPSFAIEGTGPGGSGEGYGGYVLFDLLALTPRAPASLFVLDTEGVTRWHLGRSDGLVGPHSVFAGAKLRPDGTILYLRDLTLYVIDEMGVVQTEISAADLGLPGLHHDVIELDNGNFMALGYTFRDIEYPDLGLTHVAGDLIVEVTPEGDLVWEWDAFDHLDPQRRREGFGDLIFDPTTGEFGQDWTHGNGMVYRAETDTVTFSMRHQDWVIEIDHVSGDVLWRLGLEGDFTLTDGTWPYHQHSPEWQADGTLLLYDNGLGNPELDDALETSRAVRYALDTTTMTASEAWEDEAEDFLSVFAGDADRLPDGSILVTDSSIGLELGPQAIYARVREIDEHRSGTPQWSLVTELGTFIYRCVASDTLPGEVP